MSRPLSTVAATAAAALIATAAFAQTARDAVGATPWETLDNEAPPRLSVDPPLAEPLSRGAMVVQYRVENFRILPVVGAAAVKVSPRIGHLHVTVDDLPWHWADAGASNTIIVVGLPPGPHSVRLELADPEHRVLTGQTVRFTVPETAAHMH